MGCRSWFPTQDACPACGWERPAPNRALHVAALNGNLNAQVEMGHREESAYQRSLHEEDRIRRRHGLGPATESPLTAGEKKLLAAKPKP